jgi:hypothetical protein
MSEVPDRLAVVAAYQEPHEAHVARLRLEAQGIRAALDGEHHVAAKWVVSNMIGGVKLIVHQRDLAAARRILRIQSTAPADPLPEESSDREKSALRCPVCHSENVWRDRRRRLAFLSILLFWFPIPALSRRMHCEACGHRWDSRKATAPRSAESDQ